MLSEAGARPLNREIFAMTAQDQDGGAQKQGHEKHLLLRCS